MNPIYRIVGGCQIRILPYFPSCNFVFAKEKFFDSHSFCVIGVLVHNSVVWMESLEISETDSRIFVLTPDKSRVNKRSEIIFKR